MPPSHVTSGSYVIHVRATQRYRGRGKAQVEQASRVPVIYCDSAMPCHEAACLMEARPPRSGKLRLVHTRRLVTYSSAASMSLGRTRASMVYRAQLRASLCVFRRAGGDAPWPGLARASDAATSLQRRVFTWALRCCTCSRTAPRAHRLLTEWLQNVATGRARLVV